MLWPQREMNSLKDRTKTSEPHNCPVLLPWENEKTMLLRGKTQAEPWTLLWADRTESQGRWKQKEFTGQRRKMCRDSSADLQEASLQAFSRVLIGICVWRNSPRPWKGSLKMIKEKRIRSSHQPSNNACSY